MKVVVKQKTKASKVPRPDPKAAAQAALRNVAAWVESPSAWHVMFGAGAHSKVEQAALEEAKALVANYVRLGAR